jgi:hypothetical protein
MEALIIKPATMHIYKFNGGKSYTNITTGVSGNIPENILASDFVIPAKLNIMANKNPNIIKLIELLGMQVDNESI